MENETMIAKNQLGQHRCPTCCRVCDEYVRPFSRRNISVLRIFRGAWVAAGRVPIRLDQAIKGNSELIALRNCLPFGLIAKGEVRGEWYLTSLGEDFLKGVATVPISVTKYNGRVIEESECRGYIFDSWPDTDNPSSEKWRGMPEGEFVL